VTNSGEEDAGFANFQVASRFLLLICFIGYIVANFKLFSFFVNKKALLINNEQRKLRPFEKLVICYLIIWFTLIVTVTCLYLASLVQALIRGANGKKREGHKITDSIFFTLVRIQDFLLSLMITVIFYRLAIKK
jgi:hypothetical protein